ncbi:MAG: methyl-accepting chemotaxis protein [Planctomycetaceae bacterium]|nr:methyl-accepting chemotaxis protein [Planctomycetaceae bacterium]
MSGFFRSIFESIVGRLILAFVLPTCVMTLLLITLTTMSEYRDLMASSEQHLTATTSLLALRIEEQNHEASWTSQRMAEAQTSGMFGDRATSLKFAKTILENYPDITAAYFGYEPNADGADADAASSDIPPEAMDALGRFIPYWDITDLNTRALELRPLVDMETNDYYRGAKERFEQTGKIESTFTEPYVYEGKMIVEHTYPIVLNNKFMGVAGVDRGLVEVEQQLRRFAKESKVDLFLISAKGRFIATTIDPMVESQGDTSSLLKTQAVVETDYGELFGEILRNKKSTFLVNSVDPVDGEKYFFFSAEIPTGDWTLILRKSEAAILTPIRSQLWKNAALAGVGFFCIITILIFVVLRIARRIRQAASAAGQVAAGDLTQDLGDIKCKDETGMLLRSLGTMTENLNSLVGNVKHASIKLNSTATELAATSREQQSTASSFGASSTQIAAAVKQISSTTGELVETMTEVSEAANDATGLATSGQQGLTEMESNMRGLDEATSSFGDKLSVINEKAANITGIVTTITKVADQTNLLSVNAAIEAEKAGEYGVGFLVVAREIRRLADQTASATLDIEQMVAQMQSAVSAGVMEMDRFTDQVRHSVKDVEHISNQLSEVIARVAENTARFERVNESMQSQAQGADQINSAMSQLMNHASGSSDAADECARAASELQDSIGSLKSSISSFQLRAE